jgi:hypothetical protein
MVGAARSRGLGVTLERARQRAAALDLRTEREIDGFGLGRPKEVFSQIRAYLFRRAEEMRERNNPYQLLKFRPEDNGVALIELGPRFDKGLEPTYFALTPAHGSASA